MFQKRTSCTITQLEKIACGLGLDPQRVIPAAYVPAVDYGREQFIDRFFITINPNIAENTISVKVSGTYVEYYGTGYKDSDGFWHPTVPTKKKFEYKEIIR